jgi:hypothetical protein
MRLIRRTALLAAGFALVASAGLAQETTKMDPLLKLLVEKGVVTQQEAMTLQGEYSRRQAAEAEQQHAQTVSAARSAVAELPPAKVELPKALQGLKIGMLAYISYQDGTSYSGVPGQTKDYSRFTLKRGYLDVNKSVTPFLDARITTDLHQDSTGDWKPRFKYVYGKFKWAGSGVLQKPYVEFGLAHMPWLDYEEHINRFRMQDPMFMERNGLFNSADVGVMFGGNFGEDLPAEYKKNVNSHYAGRYGSYQVGVYNGTGYHTAEANTNKVIEGRVSLRPLPDSLPGLQFSLFGVNGKGNTAAEPDWNLYAFMTSYESPRWVATAQYFSGTGNQSGGAIDSTGASVDRKGYSVFTEVRLGESANYSLIGRYDHFDPNSSSGASNDDIQKRWIAGVAWQFAHGNYWLLDFENLNHDIPSIPNEKRVQLTLQLSY